MSQTVAPATEKQVAYLFSLAAKRVVPADLMEEISSAEDGLLAKATASHLIDLVKELPYRRTAPTSVQTVTSAPVRQIPVGLWTVVDGEGHVTLKVEEASWANGKTVISYLSGSDNERAYTGFAFMTEQGVKVWGSKSHLHRQIAAAQFLTTGSLDEARENFLQVAEAHALASGSCLACGRTLTVPASLHRGLGPVCAQRLL